MVDEERNGRAFHVILLLLLCVERVGFEGTKQLKEQGRVVVEAMSEREKNREVICVP